MDPVSERIRYDIWWRVEAGYQSREEIIASVVANWQSDQNSTDFGVAVQRATDEVIAEHMRDQANWPVVTDYDRLDQAFAELDANGILTRQNYEYTLTSGCAAIRAEIEREQSKRPIRGFVFFHEQDTEQAVRCDGPVLAWGAVAEDETGWKALAEEIMAAVRRHGLKCSWHGETNSRISIDGMTWYRRRSASVSTSTILPGRRPPGRFARVRHQHGGPRN